MINVSLVCTGKATRGFIIKGHSGYAGEGSDIVCASVSSAAYMAANTVTDVIGAEAQAEVKDGYMSFLVDSTDDVSVRAVLDGFVLHLKELQQQFPEYITIKAIEK